VPFSLLPERFHFLDGGFFRRFALRREASFHVFETAAKFGVGPAQGLFRVDFEEPGYIHNHE